MYSEKRVQEAQAALERKLGFSLVRNSFSVCEEMSYRLRTAYDEAGTQIRQLSAEEEEFVSNEILLSKIDYRYWVERYCSISSASGRLEPMKLLPSQVKLLKKIGELEEASYPLPVGKVAVIVPKARRVGATAFGQSALAHGYLLRPQCFALTASDIPENTLKLYQIQLRIYDNLPVWMKPVLDGKVKADHLHIPSLDSDLTFGTGNQKNPMGQGIRLDFIHATETSTWEPGTVSMLDDDVLPAFLSSQVRTSLTMIESTGKGGEGNWFYEQCQQAKDRKGYFRVIFLSWYDRPDLHTMPSDGIEIPLVVQQLGDRISREHGVQVTKDQLAWYAITKEHFESKGKLDDFLSEYPTTLDECFRHGLKSVFPYELREELRNGAKNATSYVAICTETGKSEVVPYPEDGPKSHLVIWEPPEEGSTYVVGVDASHGLGKDRHAVEVLRKGVLGEPDEQVAEYWSDDISPFQLATVVDWVARFYSGEYPATVIIETNPGSPGQITQQELIRRGFPTLYINKRWGAVGAKKGTSYGFPTTPATRNVVTSCLEDNIKNKMVLLHSPFLFREMDHFVETWTESGRRHHGHAEGKDFHDDGLFALGLALLAAHENEVGWMAEERRKTVAQKKAEEEAPPPPPYHMRSDLVTMEDVWADFYEKAERMNAWN